MRPVFKLPITRKIANELFRYEPTRGRIVHRQTRVNAAGAPIASKNKNAGYVESSRRLIQYDNYKCLATDFIGFLKYGRWFCYEPRDGDYCNLKWENLKRS